MIHDGSRRQELLSFDLVNSTYQQFFKKLDTRFVKRFVKCDLLQKIC